MKAKTTCEQIIKQLIQNGYRYQLSTRDLEKAIMEQRGIDERTVKRWTKALVTFGYLKPETPKTYSINPLAIPELMETLKTQPQTRMM